MRLSAKNGFTLIELLIVVAIIAILAAIAVPNFLEAQTRSKISRAKADLRSMAIAVESYQVDNNVYPIPANEMGVTLVPPADYSTINTAFYLTRLPATLTTPVAYITSLLLDPFQTQLPTQGEKLFLYSTYRYARDKDGGSATRFVNFMYDLYGQYDTAVAYFLLSIGPDLIQNDPTAPGGAVLYDPTNGTVSKGDIPYLGPGSGFRN